MIISTLDRLTPLQHAPRLPPLFLQTTFLPEGRAFTGRSGTLDVSLPLQTTFLTEGRVFTGRSGTLDLMSPSPSTPLNDPHPPEFDPHEGPAPVTAARP